jgi:hypothetical protein
MNLIYGVDSFNEVFFFVCDPNGHCIKLTLEILINTALRGCKMTKRNNRLK